MAIDITQLVKDQLEPVLGLDTTIEAAIPRQVAAQLALRQWSIAAIADDQAVYISILATKALVPRLLQKFALRIEEAKGGPSEARFAKAVEYLIALMGELREQADLAAWNVDPKEFKPGQLRKPSYPTPDLKEI